MYFKLMKLEECLSSRLGIDLIELDIFLWLAYVGGQT